MRSKSRRFVMRSHEVKLSLQVRFVVFVRDISLFADTVYKQQ